MKQTSLPFGRNVGIAWKNGEFSVSRLMGVPHGPDLFLALDHPDVDLGYVAGPARREEQLLSFWLIAGPNSGPASVDLRAHVDRGPKASQLPRDAIQISKSPRPSGRTESQ